MQTLNKAFAILRTTLLDGARRKVRVYADTLILLVRVFLLTGLYQYTLKAHADAAIFEKVTIQVIAWNFYLYGAFGLFRIRALTDEITKDVRSGSAELQLIRPISYLFFKNWWQIGHNLLSSVITIAITAPLMLFWVGIPEQLTTLNYVLLVCFSILGVILSLNIYGLIGLCAFWIDDPKPIHMIIDKSIMILGGAYFPIVMFSPTLAWFAKYSPLGATQFVTSSFLTDMQNQWPTYIGIQLIWVILSTICIKLVSHRALLKMSVNGG